MFFTGSVIPLLTPPYVRALANGVEFFCSQRKCGNFLSMGSPGDPLFFPAELEFTRSIERLHYRVAAKNELPKSAQAVPYTPRGAHGTEAAVAQLPGEWKIARKQLSLSLFVRAI